MDSFPFVKMHGAGNDFVVLWQKDIPSGAKGNIEEFYRQICNRHFGIGADQLLLLSEVEKDGTKYYHMDTLNADGSDGGMCGNGLRCVALYLLRHGYVSAPEFIVATPSGLKPVRVFEQKSAAVNMRSPQFEYASLPAVVKSEPPVIDIDGQQFDVSLVSMGNPHCIIFGDKSLQADIEVLGPKVEHHAMFPERTNVMVARVVNEHYIDVAHWERGSGMTLACGTGACATAAAAIVKGLAKSPVTIAMEGGNIEIEWQGGDSDLWMSGPVHEVFRGNYLSQESGRE